jgi:hypothetical protein
MLFNLLPGIFVCEEWKFALKFSSKYMRDMIQSPESFGTNEEQHIEGSLNQSPESFDSNEQQHTKWSLF